MSHGHDEHGHAAPSPQVPEGVAGAATHGPAEVPAEPPVRTISPAATDLPFALPLPGVLWPVVWAGVGALLFWAADRSKGEVVAHEGSEHAPAAHGAPAHGAPADGAPAHGEPAHGEK